MPQGIQAKGVRTSLLGTNCHFPDTRRDNQNPSGFVAVIPVDILGALRPVSWLRRLLVTAPQESLVMVIGRYMYDGYLEGWMEHRHPYAIGNHANTMAWLGNGVSSVLVLDHH